MELPDNRPRSPQPYHTMSVPGTNKGTRRVLYNKTKFLNRGERGLKHNIRGVEAARVCARATESRVATTLACRCHRAASVGRAGRKAVGKLGVSLTTHQRVIIPASGKDADGEA